MAKHIEDIILFNELAGNTTYIFNVRQSALYFGLQLEEMGEKMKTLGLEYPGAYIAELGIQFKRGTHDHLFDGCNRHALLDDDVDQFVVTVGSLISQGVDVLGAIEEVNRANLAKRFPDGTLHKDENGKIVKPDGWTPPDLTPFLWRDKTYDKAGGHQSWVNPNEL